MKCKPIILLLTCLLTCNVFAEYYYYQGERIFLTLANDFQSKITLKANSAAGAPSALRVKNKQQEQLSYSEVSDIEFGIFTNSVESSNTASEFTKAENTVLYFNALKNKNGEVLYQNNYLYVKIKDEDETLALDDAIAKYDLIFVGQNEFMPLWYTLSISSMTGMSSLEVANALYESGEFQAAEPDLYNMNALQTTNDRYYLKQWNIHQYGYYPNLMIQPGQLPNFGTNAEKAWLDATGNGIKVAVIDFGVMTSHPDLHDNIFCDGYDAYTRTTPATNPYLRYKDNDNFDEIPWYHGTQCASVVASIMNNEIGIAGVAPDSKIIPISVDFTGGALDIQLADAINWACNNGADIINCSWSGANSMVISDAIEQCFNKGRNKRGCIVVCSTGNNNLSEVAFPANCNPYILAVGANNNSGKRCSNWREYDIQGNFLGYKGSNYGTELDVVAPGENIYVASSTQLGEPYYTISRGTSLSTPIVSGIAAMVLEINPEFTHKQVHDIIVTSVNKLDGYTYTSCAHHVHGEENTRSTWNEEVGHGLVDATKCIMEAKSIAMGITGDSFLEKGKDYEYYIEGQPKLCYWNLINPTSHIEIVETPNIKSWQDPFILTSAMGEPSIEIIEAETYSQNWNKYTFRKTIHTNADKGSFLSGRINQPQCFAYNIPYPDYNESFTQTNNIYIYEECMAEICFTPETANGWYCQLSDGSAKPNTWGYNSTNHILTVSLPRYYGGVPFRFEFTSDLGKKYLNIFTMKSTLTSAVSLSTSPGVLEVEITNTELFGEDKDSDIMSVEVVNIQTGDNYTKIVSGSTCTFETDKWEKGFYIVNTRLGNTYVVSKIVIE